MKKVSRRGLVTALAGAGVLLGTSRRASAFTEERATGRALALHQNACGATASHKELVAEVERVLGDRYSAGQKRQVMAMLTCPICGCALAGLS
jgi:hypothetical protein